MNENEKKILADFGAVVNGLNTEQLERLLLIARGMEINETMHKAG